MKKTSTLIKNADVVVTMDAHRAELKGASILIENGAITQVGNNLSSADEVVDASGCVVTYRLCGNSIPVLMLRDPRSRIMPPTIWKYLSTYFL